MPQVMVVDNGALPGAWSELLGAVSEAGNNQFNLFENVVPTSYSEARALFFEALDAGAMPDVIVIDHVLNLSGDG